MAHLLLTIRRSYCFLNKCRKKSIDHQRTLGLREVAAAVCSGTYQLFACFALGHDSAGQRHRFSGALFAGCKSAVTLAHRLRENRGVDKRKGSKQFISAWLTWMVVLAANEEGYGVHEEPRSR